MDLTGQCAKDFDNWLREVHYKCRHDVGLHFVGCTDAMVFGALQDFFDSKDYFIQFMQNLGGGQPVYYVEIQHRDSEFMEYSWEIQWDNGELMPMDLKTAREEAIIKLNEIYNLNTTQND